MCGYSRTEFDCATPKPNRTKRNYAKNTIDESIIILFQSYTVNQTMFLIKPTTTARRANETQLNDSIVIARPHRKWYYAENVLNFWAPPVNTVDFHMYLSLSAKCAAIDWPSSVCKTNLNYVLHILKYCGHLRAGVNTSNDTHRGARCVCVCVDLTAIGIIRQY